ncbi:hypothetical protein E2562_003395 [Oryza meyeriana var. granulata]|uniref:DUF834 domain-containing protein n=1 Tax=Oryza meyeriana var. granulata TaxID=110450 RepID=A0A6G1EFJ0_9ORYZ|nr:hypothetical protein E2562_003395 [Oryza meyeriana var. granulata]
MKLDGEHLWLSWLRVASVWDSSPTPAGGNKEEVVNLGGEAGRDLGATEHVEVGGDRLRAVWVSVTAMVERLGNRGCEVGTWKSWKSVGYQSTKETSGWWYGRPR